MTWTVTCRIAELGKGCLHTRTGAASLPPKPGIAVPKLGRYRTGPEGSTKAGPMAMPRRKPQRDISRRAVYIDHLGRFVWYRDSWGHKSDPVIVRAGEDPIAVAHRVEAELDRDDPTPSSVESPGFLWLMK